MAVSRRQVIKLGQAALVTAAMPAVRAGAAENRAAGLYSKQRFVPLVNSSFAVQSARTWLSLVSVEDLAVQAAAQPKMETFALHFFGAGDALQQGTFELEHAKLGVFSLFLVPAGDFKYLAVINNLESLPPGIQPPIKKRPGDAPTARGNRPPTRPGSPAAQTDVAKG